jgi:hypothetical protein
VGGERVPVVEVPRASVRRGDVDGASVVERHDSASVDDRSDVSGLAVDDAEPVVLAASDDTVADRERATVGHQLVASDAPELAKGVARPLVEVRDVVTAVSEHDGSLCSLSRFWRASDKMRLLW